MRAKSFLLYVVYLLYVFNFDVSNRFRLSQLNFWPSRFQHVFRLYKHVARGSEWQKMNSWVYKKQTVFVRTATPLISIHFTHHSHPSARPSFPRLYVRVRKLTAKNSDTFLCPTFLFLRLPFFLYTDDWDVNIPCYLFIARTMSRLFFTPIPTESWINKEGGSNAVYNPLFSGDSPKS